MNLEELPEPEEKLPADIGESSNSHNDFNEAFNQIVKQDNFYDYQEILKISTLFADISQEKLNRVIEDAKKEQNLKRKYIKLRWLRIVKHCVFKLKRLAAELNEKTRLLLF